VAEAAALAQDQAVDIDLAPFAVNRGAEVAASPA